MPTPAHMFIPAFGAAAVVVWRIQETTRPLSSKKILIPPLAMSTGNLMFLYPPFRMPVTWALGAFLTGFLLFSVPLIKTSELKIQTDKIFLKRSKAFLWVILGLVAVRWGMRSYISQYVSLLQTASLFYLLAFGMIVRWRADMWKRFQKLMGTATQVE